METFESVELVQLVGPLPLRACLARPGPDPTAARSFVASVARAEATALGRRTEKPVPGGFADMCEHARVDQLTSLNATASSRTGAAQSALRVSAAEAGSRFSLPEISREPTQNNYEQPLSADACF